MADPSSSNDWCTIESDPGVFTELLQSIGCQTVELQELWSLDDDSLRHLQQSTGAIYGLIFLFQWIGQDQQEHASQKQVLEEDAIPENLFFAHQITTNACATQAILSVLMNNVQVQTEGETNDHHNSSNSNSNSKKEKNNNNKKLSKQDLGETLSEFHSFTASFGPHLKGVAISSSEQIKQAHNAFARPDGFLTAEDAKPIVSPDEHEAFHFVAYVPVNGIVYELDGLQRAPLVIGAYSEEEDKSHETDAAMSDNDAAEGAGIDDWLVQARTAIQERMAKAAEGHVKFNLMAVIQDKRLHLQQQLQNATATATSTATDMSTEQHHDLMAALAAEHAKRDEWKAENQRRRHNYVPLCVQMLKELARMKQLPGLIEQAREKQQQQRNNKKK